MKFQNFRFVGLMLVLSSFFVMTAVQTAPAQNEEKVIELSRSDFDSRNRSITLNRSGSYRLRDDVNVRNGDAVTITASNVTLDLGGHTVSTDEFGSGNGIFVNGVSGVEVRNGKVSGFNFNVNVTNGVNIRIRNLQILGKGLAPAPGPREFGVLLLQTRGAYIENNTISSVNLGIFIRGGNSTGNRIFENVLIGGATPTSNLLGICYNPATGAGTEGPRGDNIYNNHVTRFRYAFAISSGSVFNVFNENISASFVGAFREPQTLTDNGGTNVSDGNIEVVIPATVLPN
jgi:hypothetical protein